jgi:hypothetical protein
MGFALRRIAAQTLEMTPHSALRTPHHHNGADYFPAYGLDSDAGFRPTKALAYVIEVFTGHKDEWGMAYWVRSPNSFLGAPNGLDHLLGKKPGQVVEAAHDEVRGVGHG